MSESKNKVQNSDVLSLDEAAEFLKISRATMMRIMKDRRRRAKIGGVKVGHQWRFSRGRLVNMIEKAN